MTAYVDCKREEKIAQAKTEVLKPDFLKACEYEYARTPENCFNIGSACIYRIEQSTWYYDKKIQAMQKALDEAKNKWETENPAGRYISGTWGIRFQGTAKS